MSKLVYGVGINDADYVTRKTINGKVVLSCKFFEVWRGVIRRCYSEESLRNHPTYAGCSVCDEWLTFSNFKAWMETQDWKGKEIDKDIINKGNKIYSPEFCVFVDSMTNSFIIDCGSVRGEWPIGVTFHKRNNEFRAQCSDPFTKVRGWIGAFKCPNEAHQAWRKRKHELACQLADLQTDQRVADALRARYA